MAASSKEQSNLRQYALIAGIALIVMTVAASFSYGFVHGSLVVKGDAGTTFNNIKSSPMLFKAEIVGWLIILITDIVVAWAFYNFLKPINENLSLLGALFRLVYASLLGIAIWNLIVVMLLSNRTDHLLAPDQLQAHVMLNLEAFDFIWSLGLIIFGGHLMIVGFLAYSSDRIPRVIGILLWIASIGYIVIHLGKTIFSQYDGIIRILEYLFTAPMIAGELGFGIWLLIKGGKVTKRI
jgi:hypothetical protein